MTRSLLRRVVPQSAKIIVNEAPERQSAVDKASNFGAPDKDPDVKAESKTAWKLVPAQMEGCTNVGRRSVVPVKVDINNPQQAPAGVLKRGSVVPSLQQPTVSKPAAGTDSTSVVRTSGRPERTSTPGATEKAAPQKVQISNNPASKPVDGRMQEKPAAGVDPMNPISAISPSAKRDGDSGVGRRQVVPVKVDINNPQQTPAGVPKRGSVVPSLQQPPVSKPAAGTDSTSVVRTSGRPERTSTPGATEKAAPQKVQTSNNPASKPVDGRMQEKPAAGVDPMNPISAISPSAKRDGDSGVGRRQVVSVKVDINNPQQAPAGVPKRGSVVPSLQQPPVSAPPAGAKRAPVSVSCASESPKRTSTSGAPKKAAVPEAQNNPPSEPMGGPNQEKTATGVNPMNSIPVTCSPATRGGDSGVGRRQVAPVKVKIDNPQPEPTGEPNQEKPATGVNPMNSISVTCSPATRGGDSGVGRRQVAPVRVKIDNPQSEPTGEPNQEKPATGVNPMNSISATCSPATRGGDSGVGRRPVKCVKINPQDLPPKQTVVTVQEKNVEEELYVTDGFFMPSILSKFLRLTLICLAAFASFFLITQTASFLADVRKLTLLEQITLALPLVGFGCVIIWIVFKLIIYSVRLKVSPQIKIKALQELEERRSLRKLSLKQNREAVKKLADYLQNDFSIKTDTLKSWGINQDIIRKFEKNKQRLIEQAQTPASTSQDWLADFRCNIQDQLDEIAQKRILKYSINTAIMSGISPFSLIDRLIVLSSSLGMLKELLELYSLKPSWDKNLVLMAQVIINTYCAGIFGDMADSALDNFANFAEKSVLQNPELAEKIPGAVFSVIRCAGKPAEAGMQGVMVYRLGKSALKILHAIEK